MFPTRRAAALLVVLGLVSVLLPAPVVVPLLGTGLVVGLTIVDLVVSRRVLSDWERSSVPTLARGVPVPFSVSVGRSSGRLVRLRQPAPAGVSVTPAQGTHSPGLEGSIVGDHRGIHVLPPPVVRVSGPLGLGATDQTLGGPTEVTVLPDLPGARRQAIATRRARTSEEGRLHDRLGLGTEFDSIRDYAPDDDIRQVNWMATARVGRVMSNQFRIEANRDLICVIDTGRLMGAPLGGASRLDAALDAVAATAVAAEEAGDRVGVVAFADSILRVLMPRRRAAEMAVRAIFDLEAKETDSDYQRAFEVVGGWKRALVAIFTDLMDESAARTLLEAFPVLARRHAMMVASCTDVDLISAVRTEPEEPYEVLRASVAADLLAGRERVAGLLRSFGAVVVEETPEKLGAACVSGYLSLKQRARV